MSQSFKNIYIPDPCHAGWNKMTAMEKGRFCQSCQSKVYDFRKASIEEVVKVYRESKGYACATFYDDQINQSIKYNIRSGSWIKKFRISLIAFFTTVWLKIMLTGNAQAHYSGEKRLPRQSMQVQENDSLKVVEVIKGKVIEKGFSYGISNISVELRSENKECIGTALTDSDGSFEIKLTKRLLEASYFLVIQKKKIDTYNKKIIIHSLSKEIDKNSGEPMVLEVEKTYRKKPFKKKEIIRTGRFRMD